MKTFSNRASGNGGWRWPGKSQGLDAGGWFDTEIGERGDPKSISHEHTFNTDTKDPEQLEATLTHLAEKVARRLREHATACPHDSAEAALFRFLDHHARPYVRVARRSSISISSSIPASCCVRTGIAEPGDSSARSADFGIRARSGATRSDGWRAHRALASGPRGRRQTARPLRRIRRRARVGHAGTVPRTSAGESGSAAR